MTQSFCIVPGCHNEADQEWVVVMPGTPAELKVGMCMGHVELARSGQAFVIPIHGEPLEVVNPFASMTRRRLDA